MILFMSWLRIRACSLALWLGDCGRSTPVDCYYGVCWIAPLGWRLREAGLRALRGFDLDGQVVTDRLPFPPDGNRLEFHHVVAQALPGAQQSRDIVALHGIGIDDLANAAILPLSFHQGAGLHTDLFIRNVNRYLTLANYVAVVALEAEGARAGRAALLERLRSLGDLLSARSGSRYAAAWQSILRAAERLQPR